MKAVLLACSSTRRFAIGNLAIYVEQSVAAADTLANSAAVVIVINEDGE